MSSTTTDIILIVIAGLSAIKLISTCLYPCHMYIAAILLKIFGVKVNIKDVVDKIQQSQQPLLPVNIPMQTIRPQLPQVPYLERS